MGAALDSLFEDKKESISALDKLFEDAKTTDTPTSTNSPFKNTTPPVNYETDRPSAENRSETKLSVTELTQDKESVKNIRRYMKERHGYGMDLDDDEVVDKFINHMRSFHGGNSITTLTETAWISSADDQQRALAGMAYGEFDKLGNIFGEKASWGEMFDGIYDYGWAAIVDPINLIGFGAGKLAGTVSSKAASKTIIELSKKASQKKFGKKVVSDKVRNDFEKKFIKTVMDGARSNKKPRRLEVDDDTFSTLVNKSDPTKKVTRELMSATGTDAALSVGIDVAYQGGLIKTMQQEDYSIFQSGLAALGSLVSGGLAAGSLFVKKKTKGPSTEIAAKLAKTKEEGNKKVGKEIKNTLTKTFQYHAGIGKVQAEIVAKKTGDNIGLDEMSFWKTFLLGVGENPNAPEIRGLAHNIKDAGLVWEGPRHEGDNWTNWIADIIKNHGDLPDLKTFIKTFNTIKRHKGKAFLPDYDKALDEIAIQNGFKKGTDLPEDVQLEFFANRLSFLVSNNSKMLNALSQGANITRAKNLPEIDPKIDAKDLASDLEIPTIFEKGKNTADYVQSTIIRNIVTHPGTTALNLTGWSAYSGLQSATDIIKSALYSPVIFFNNKMTKEEKAKYFRNAVTLQSNKLRNLIDPETTIESFKSYLEARPAAGRTLMRYLAGGVEQTESFKKQFGFDPNENMLGRGVENYTNFFQTIYGVKAQDVLTKSVEYMYNIEKQVMRKYGVTFDEFVNRKDLASVMSTDDYLKIEAKAVDDTLRSVYSKRYGSARFDFKNDIVGSAAKAIEDFRKIPVLGLAMPFGQFFNNTIDFMSDMVGGGALRSAVKYFRKTADGERLAEAADVGDATIKAGIFWTSILAFSTKEAQALEEGLGMFEERDENTGKVRNVQYDYPYSLWKGVGRAIAHMARDGAIPPEVNKTLGETFGFGQFSRQLGQYTNALSGTYKDLTEGNLSLSLDTLGKLTGKITAQAVSGTTRALDPINQAVGMAQGDNFIGIDRRQGIETLNKSLRYVDNIFIGGMRLLDKDYKPPEKFKTTTDIKAAAQPARLLGFREVPKHSDIQKMFNSIGRPEWRSGIFSKVAEADNRINELIFPQLEQLAGVAMRSKRWKEGSSQDRINMVAGVMQVAKERVSHIMQSSPIIKDRKLDMMFKISKRVGKTKLDKYLKEFVGAGNIEDLSLYQLELLNNLIMEDSSRKEAKKLRNFY